MYASDRERSLTEPQDPVTWRGVGAVGRFRGLMQDVSVLAILVATDGEAWLPEVIRGLLAQSHTPLEVIAVDNASSDASSKMLSKTFGANAVVLERRVGFGRALAAGLKIATERGTDAD